MMLLIMIILSLFMISIIFLLYSLRKLPYPPGPKGYPIIGNMGMMDRLNHRSLANLAKQYCGLLHLQMGQLHVVAVSTPEMAQEVLQVQDAIFANRPANIALTYLTYNRSDLAFAHYGPFWRQMRKLCVMKLFSRKRAESWASVREEVDSMIGKVLDKTGSPVNIGELVFALTRKITYRAAFGSEINERQDEFMKILQEFSKLSGAFNIADFFPWLGLIRAKDFHKKLARARESLDSFIDKVVEHKEKKNNSENRRKEADIVDELMACYSEDVVKNGFDGSLSKNNIKAIILDVMFGGTETVASALEWAMSELMKSPEDLKKVQQELTEVVGLNRRVQETDFENLTYLKCAIKETLRLHPPVPLLLHETAEDSIVKSYRIPAKSRVMINAWAIGRDPNAWTDADKFKPSRFMEDGAPDFKGTNFEYIPFGSGRRSCPGLQLGMYELELAVANLLHCFKWELPDDMKASELDMNDVAGLAARKAVRLVAVPTYRLN